MTDNVTNDFKQEIVSEIALQLLPTIYAKAIDIVKKHNEYVNVDDKLPDEGVKVLAWHSRKEKFFIATYDRELKIWLNDGKPYSSEFLYSITHWIPMPSPPREVK